MTVLQNVHVINGPDGLGKQATNACQGEPV